MPTKRGSITRRLLLAMLVAMPLLLGLTGLAIDSAYQSSLLKAEDSRLKALFFGLLGAIEWRDGAIDMGDRVKEPLFWQFRSGLYADIRGGDGELLWQSTSADTLELPQVVGSIPSGEGYFGELPVEGAPYFYYRYLAIWETDDGNEVPLLFSIYSEKRGMLRELTQFRQQLSVWLGLVVIFSIMLVALIQYWALLPLRRLARDLRHLEQGRRDQLVDSYPLELQSITANLNQLLSKERKQRERYRNTLGDLAHSLKTPLAVLRDKHLDPEARQEQLQRMDNIIRYQLRRAVSAGGGLHHQTLTHPLLSSLANTMDKVYRDKQLSISLDLDEQFSLPADEQDIMELCGNLLDNACKAARTEVTISGSHTGNYTTLCFDDDGEGIAPEDHRGLLERGKRGDQYGDGQGLGLAIVLDIVDSYGADFRFDTSPLGGTRAILRFKNPA